MIEQLLEIIRVNLEKDNKFMLDNENKGNENPPEEARRVAEQSKTTTLL